MSKYPKMINDSSPANQLRLEYERQNALFDTQLPIVQRFLEAQALQIAEAYAERAQRVHFMLPDRVIAAVGTEPIVVPQAIREQRVGVFADKLARRDIHDTLRQRLTELEQSNDQAIVIAASLVRFASATHMVRNMLPSGKIVTYVPAEEDDIPSIPVSKGTEPESAMTAPTDAIAEEGNLEAGRGSLQVPYVPAARRFYLPQWVAFGNKGELLVNTVKEAEAHIASMQHFLNVLFAARSLAPFMVADDEFEKKRYGMLGQLVNQGRALANYRTNEIINLIKKRVAEHSLNRGLSLRLPYFDDQDLRIETHDFVVIPAGRIMFVPAFVVRASLDEQAKIAQDTRFSHSTRRLLLAELQALGNAFESSDYTSARSLR
ncbi:MAG: hypothetical protein NTV38_11690 [Chloroflexi bacterium]|nr:hypothetical protein [Chloroflexota bacterium]